MDWKKGNGIAIFEELEMVLEVMYFIISVIIKGLLYVYAKMIKVIFLVGILLLLGHQGKIIILIIIVFYLL